MATGGPASTIRGPDDFAQAFAVSRETLGRLELYANLLKHWQKTINLVAPSTLPHIWQRHFADSAQLLNRAPIHARTWLDIGSGAGFPGLVLAILLADRNAGEKPGAAIDHSDPNAAPTPGSSRRRPGPRSTSRRISDVCLVPGLRRDDDIGGGGSVARAAGSTIQLITLVESDSRKAAFLREVARQTGVTVDILCARIESPSTHAKVGQIDCVTARALAPLGRLLDMAAPFFEPNTKGLFLKGREVEAEIGDARQDWEFDLALHPSLSGPEGRIAVISNLRVKSEG